MNSATFVLKGIAGQLSVFNDKIVIGRKGVHAALVHGLKGDKVIPMNAIQSVQFKEGTTFTNGYIQFGILGGRESTGGLRSAVLDENSVPFKKSENKTAYAIKEYIENIVLSRQNAYNAPQQPVTSTADELIKYKQLYESGFITWEEFEAKKRQLLG